MAKKHTARVVTGFDVTDGSATDKRLNAWGGRDVALSKITGIQRNKGLLYPVEINGVVVWHRFLGGTDDIHFIPYDPRINLEDALIFAGVTFNEDIDEVTLTDTKWRISDVTHTLANPITYPIPAPEGTGLLRIDNIVADYNGQLTYQTGEPDVTAVAPEVPYKHILVTTIYVSLEVTTEVPAPVSYPDVRFRSGTGNPTQALGIAGDSYLNESNGEIWFKTLIVDEVATWEKRYAPTVGSGVPDGGTTGQVLKKLSATDGDADWQDDAGGSSEPVWRRKGVVLTATATADQDNVFEPTVIREGSPQILTSATLVFKMWFTAGWTNPNICYAESVDGLTWTRHATAVVANHSRSCVLKVGSTYYMYAAPSTTGLQINRYTSTNGLTWTLGTSAVISKGGGGWKNLAVQNCSVIVESGTWKMLLEGNSGTVYSLGYFTSADGITWTEYGSNPVISINGQSGPDIHKIGSTYYAWCHGIGAPAGLLPTQAYRYSSSDMTTWTQDTAASTFPRRDDDEGPQASGGQVADLSLLEVDGAVYMYYSASRNGLLQAGGLRIKLAIASMPFTDLVGTQEGDGGVVDRNTTFPMVASGVEKVLTVTSSGVQKTYDTVEQVVSASSLTGATWTTGIASVSGIAGQVAYDTNYRYDCIAANQWRRTALNGNLIDLSLGTINDTGGDKTSAQLQTAYPSAVIGQQAQGNNNLYIKETSTLWRKIPSTTA